MVIMRSTEDNQRDQRCWDKVASFRYTYRLARDVRGTDSIDPTDSLSLKRRAL